MIYLVEAVGSPYCKIGFAADDVFQRIAVLQCGCPFELALSETREGDVVLEKAIHAAVSEYAVRGEWFRDDPELRRLFHATEVSEGYHASVVRRAGSADQVAAIHGVSIHTVRSWIQRDSIPADKWAGFARAGHATLSQLAEAAEARGSSQVA